MHFEENGNVTPCCVMPSNVYPIAKGIDNYLKSDKLKEIKDYFLNNKRHPYCKACWDSEDNGVRSHRLYTEKPSKEIESIHIRYNNICNFKCRMCNPKFSSTWIQENKIHRYFRPNEVDKNIFDVTPDLLDFILKHRNTLKSINISGGEPFIADANLKFLRWLSKNKLTHITLSYSTNLSKIIHRNVNIIDLLATFKSVNLAISADGWGKAVEYSRHGFKWDTFVKNLNYVKYVKKQKNPNSFQLNIICVVHIHSIHTIPHLTQFCHNNKIGLIFSPCLEPKFLSVQSLPVSEKKKIIKYYQSISSAGHLYDAQKIKTHVLDYMMKEQLDSYTVKKMEYNCNEEFKRFNSLLDKTRNQDFKESFPQFSEWYDSI
tara:strand:+ start:489 stop:1610 length:1122 start_codon:yes stop_codon:yes gene_type:complete